MSKPVTSDIIEITTRGERIVRAEIKYPVIGYELQLSDLEGVPPRALVLLANQALRIISEQNACLGDWSVDPEVRARAQVEIQTILTVAKSLGDDVLKEVSTGISEQNFYLQEAQKIALNR